MSPYGRLPVFVSLLAVWVLTYGYAQANDPFIWVYDPSVSGLTSSAEVSKYLDDLGAHGARGLFIRFDSSQRKWLGQLASEAKKRGLRVIAVVPVNMDVAWTNNPDWRKKDSKGKDVLLNGTQKTFCPNSPYWENVFFPSLREIAQSIEVDGFYFDISKVAYGSEDACFCARCQTRFREETGKKLPARHVSPETWNDPGVYLHALKRVEWLNNLWERYAQEVEKAKPGALALIGTDTRLDTYKNAVSGRHTSKYSSWVTPLVADSPATYAASQMTALKKSGKSLTNASALAENEIIRSMTRYGYYEFLLKLALGDSGGKRCVPIVRSLVSAEGQQDKGWVDLEVAQIELAIGAGATGYCFNDSLASMADRSKVAGSVWQNPKFVEYLKGVTTGERAQWIADMRPDSRIAILCNRNALFWEADNSRLLKSVGGMYGLLQYWRKTPVSFILPSEPGNSESKYKLDPASLSKYDLIIAIGLDYLGREDLLTLRSYLDKGGHLMILGPIGTGAKGARGASLDPAFEILGITTEGPATPSGFFLPATKHPAFTVPGGFTGPMGSFRLNPDKYAAYSYKPKFGDGWEVLAYEVNDEGKRPAIVTKETPTYNIAYVNSDAVAAFGTEMRAILANLVVVTSVRTTSIVPTELSAVASVNTFKGSDGLTRYINIFTPHGEGETQYRIRTDPNAFPVSGRVILADGSSREIKISQENRAPDQWEMTIGKTGNGVLKLGPIKPPFATVRLQYERREARK